jgi:hypothetical protein
MRVGSCGRGVDTCRVWQEEAGVTIELVGVVDVQASRGWRRVTFLAVPTSHEAPKTLPDYESAGAVRPYESATVPDYELVLGRGSVPLTPFGPWPFEWSLPPSMRLGVVLCRRCGEWATAAAGKGAPPSLPTRCSCSV